MTTPSLPLSTLRPERTGREFAAQVAFVLMRAGAVLTRETVLGRSCFGLPWRSDFVITNAVAYPAGLAVECKWQEGNGTADEKFPYVVASIRGLPCPAIVVVGGRNARRPGHGARPQALAWLRRQVDAVHLVGVFSLEELVPWLRSLTFTPTRLF